MEKRCLIIDNDDQSATIEKLIKDAQAKGLSLECDQFNIGSTAYDEVLTDGKIDINKVVAECKSSFHKRTYHLIAFDWQLSDEVYNGVELIRAFSHHKLFRHVPKLLYSGLLEESLGDELDKFQKNELSS